MVLVLHAWWPFASGTGGDDARPDSRPTASTSHSSQLQRHVDGLTPSTSFVVDRNDNIIAAAFFVLKNKFDPGREAALNSVTRQFKCRNRLSGSYRKLKVAMIAMQDGYVASKEQRNALTRYRLLKRLIRDCIVIDFVTPAQVIVYEREYWSIIDIPKQDVRESQADYVNRVLNHLEERIKLGPIGGPSTGGGQQKPSGIRGFLSAQSNELADAAKEANYIESLKGKSTDDLRREQERLTGDIFVLCKKYLGLRQVVLRLKTSYDSTKNYPFFPRHKMLKDMIKDAVRNPAFTEIAHEQDT